MTTDKEISTTAEEAVENLTDQELDATVGGKWTSDGYLIVENFNRYSCELWTPASGHGRDEKHACRNCWDFMEEGVHSSYCKRRRNVVELRSGD